MGFNFFRLEEDGVPLYAKPWTRVKGACYLLQQRLGPTGNVLFGLSIGFILAILITFIVAAIAHSGVKFAKSADDGSDDESSITIDKPSNKSQVMEVEDLKKVAIFRTLHGFTLPEEFKNNLIQWVSDDMKLYTNTTFQDRNKICEQVVMRILRLRHEHWHCFYSTHYYYHYYYYVHFDLKDGERMILFR